MARRIRSAPLETRPYLAGSLAAGVLLGPTVSDTLMAPAVPPSPSDPAPRDNPRKPASAGPPKTPPPAHRPAAAPAGKDGPSVRKAKPPASPSAAARTGARRPAPAAVHIEVESASEELLGRIKDEARINGPGFLVSLGLHLVLLMILALIVVRHQRDDDDGALIGGWTVENLRKLATQQEVRQPVKITAVTLDSQPSPMPEKTQPAPDPAENQPKTPAVAVLKPGQVQVGNVLSGRAPEVKKELLGAFGGTARSETAVSLGLQWLASKQKSDGHWELHEGYADAGSGRTKTGATALALLPFLGAGHTHQSGGHQAVVQKGLNWLIRVQQPNGNLHDYDDFGRVTTFYAHGQATIVLCEAYALTGDTQLLEAAQKALQFLYDSQHPVTGGWKYRPQSEGDLSVFGWQLMALQSARMANIELPQDVLDKSAAFLDLVELQGGARYRYEPPGPNRPELPATLAMTAEGLLCRQYLGWPRNHPAMRTGLDWLTQPEHLPNWKNGRRNVYFWYYATQALHNSGGEPWERWNTALRDEIVANQVKSRAEKGSWHPFQPSGDPDEKAEAGGRLYVTSLCLLMLEVYYRHQPLYQTTEAPSGG